ncbi:putative plastid-lipid-associated protein 8, chloroplastic [Iris pallida]|uniref:Plastid-lipid-associated protein 8, chloroplastic n=1 Tax=Iris pallida TaxID=29817 RepID=A0AAX6H359_IRIPA|nr:putative plastid-lipid-associated protein 8, chloroplastic [Iris pallida]
MKMATESAKPKQQQPPLAPRPAILPIPRPLIPIIVPLQYLSTYEDNISAHPHARYYSFQSSTVT